jgi:flagellar biosynthesis GTPase FlhF
MRIKSYFTETIDQAMAQARADFGDDALLLSTRQTESGCEVVFGAAESEAPADLTSIRSQIDEIRQLLVASERAPELSNFFAQLSNAGFDTKIASKMVDLYENNRKVRDTFSEHIRIDATLGAPGAEGTVVAVVGPAGAGKTSAIMKIAALQKTARILTLDTSLANRMQLQLFARKTEIAFMSVEAPETLAGIVSEARRKEIVLIDTPSSEKYAHFLTAIPGIDTHLVIPAYMTAAAVRHAIAKYAAFKPSKMIITRLDESPSIGAAVSEAVHGNLAISLFTSGASIHAATMDDLISVALGPQAKAACA